MKLEIHRPLIFFDLETTGLNIDEDRIVQLAAIKFFPGHERARDNIDKRNYLINPCIPIPEKASDVHGITTADVEGLAPFDALARELFDFFRECDWAGYNIINFDVPLLLNEFDRCGIFFASMPRIIDSFCIFKDQVSHTLSGAVQFYLNKPHDDAHDALADVNATIGVFNAQLNFVDDMPKTLDGIYDKYRDPHQLDIAGKLILDDSESVIINFGKHKGKRIIDVPESYLKWCMSNSVFGPDGWDIIRDVYSGVRK